MYRRSAATLRKLDVTVRQSHVAGRSTAVRAVSLVVVGAATAGALVVAPTYITRCESAALVPAAAARPAAASSSSAARSLVDKAHDVVRAVNKVLSYLHRLILYAVLGIPVVGVASTAYVLGGVNPAIEDLVWDCCLWAIQQLGPTFVKLAQVRVGTCLEANQHSSPRIAG